MVLSGTQSINYQCYANLGFLGDLVAKRRLEISNGNQKFGVGCQMSTIFTEAKHKNRHFKGIYHQKNQKFRAHILIRALIFGCQVPNLGLTYSNASLFMLTVAIVQLLVPTAGINSAICLRVSMQHLHIAYIPIYISHTYLPVIDFVRQLFLRISTILILPTASIIWGPSRNKCSAKKIYCNENEVAKQDILAQITRIYS